MRILGKTGRKIAWLAEEIAKRRDRAAKLVRRLEAAELDHGAGAPGLREKFLRYLHEVAHEREEEARLLSRVEFIENRHRDLLLRGRLAYARHKMYSRRVNPYLRSIDSAESEQGLAAKKSRKRDEFLILMMVLWFLFARKISPSTNKTNDMTPH